jgi:DNA repair exonuclease SbcCD ATPase subunit
VFVDFLELKYKNFLSFGSNLTVIKFEEGFNLITGKNGGGKSGGLLDPLSFCIFGKPYRKIKIRELVNRTNRKKLYTECIFKINDDLFKIVRTQLPDSIELFKNDQPFQLESSKRLIQDEIDKIIGIDYNMFKQIIALAINYNKPFLEMQQNEKREIIESITNVKILGEMLKLSKINISSLKTQVDLNKTTIKLFEENLFSTNQRINELTLAKQNFDSNKQDDLNKILQKINNQTIELNKIQTILTNLEKNKKNIIEFKKELKELNKKLNEINKEINVDKYKIENSNKSISFLEQNNICEVCNSELTEEHKTKEKNRLNEIINECKNKIELNNKNKKDLTKEIDNISLEIENQNKIILDIKKYNEQIKWLKEEIKNNIERENEIKLRKFDVDLNSLQKEFDKKSDEYLEVFNKNEEKVKELHNYEVVSTILSDNGIKAYFFRKIIPILNSKINEYLKKSGLSIKFEINEFLEDKIFCLDSRGQEISYFSNSEGEKKRIDISIMLAFIDITKMICNWDCSLLIMDEIFDSKLDEDGLDFIILSIKNLISNNNKLKIFVISHILKDFEVFDRHYRVSKASGFSRIEQVY